ncbi:MAG TPA: NAD-dependent malic enzyme [Planctomycetota bacterium]|nr:NAD-dependent malic enzyme [Planctomycetota bacterium]
MHPLPPPLDDLVAGRPAAISLRGHALLGNRLLTKDLAFTPEEREAFGLQGLLPARVLDLREQVALELEHLRAKPGELEKYIGLMALQDRNATLYYRLLVENLEELLPIVYTPTVGHACQQFSHIVRRARGLWITPEDRGRIPELLRNAPNPDVRLVVVTDNERILGLGDQGAGGMAIPVGKLALYTAACGLHPSLTLPVSLDVGTDNPALRSDPLYLGRRAPRLRGAEYDALVEAFVEGVREVWPACLIQWEDLKQQNALRVLERYRSRVTSFNDDIQGTASVVVAGVLTALRHLGQSARDVRVVLAGAGAAGLGIARLLGMALRAEGLSEAEARRALVLLDSRGLVHALRADLDEAKRALAVTQAEAAAWGLSTDGPPAGLLEVVRRVRPTVLVGTTGVGGSFGEPVIRAMAAATPRPIVLPLSNPTSATEALPQDVLAWSEGRALVATGSPFAPVVRDGRRHVIAQANNVFVFPGVGLGAIVAEASGIDDRLFLVAARTLAARVDRARFESGALYPPVQELRRVSRAVAVAVASEAQAAGLARVASDTDPVAAVDAATWWPEYVPYVRAQEAGVHGTGRGLAPAGA